MERKRILFAASCLLFVCFCIFGLLLRAKESQKIISVEIKTENELNSMKEGRISSEDPIGDFVLFGEQQLPYDGNYGFYYISQSLNSEEFQGKLETTDRKIKVYFYEDNYWADKAGAIREGHPFRFIVFGDGWYSEDEVVFSGLPIISITGDLVESADKAVSNNSKLVVWDPEDKEAEGLYTIKESFCTYYERGASSRQFEKKSFGIRLFDEKGEARNKSFLGMRSDNKWILNALYSDTSKVREKIATDLWNEISPELQGTRMEYAEVFVNGFYRGIYGLMEPIDKKQLSLKEGDFLYKCSSIDGVGRGYYDGISDAMETEEFEIEFPKEWQDGIWEPLEYYTDYLADEREMDEPAVLDKENITKFWLYLQFLSASDNINKNFYILASEQENRLLIRKIPWDLNYSFGDAWSVESPNITEFGVFGIDEIFTVSDFQKLYESSEKEIITLTNQLWSAMRQSCIQADRLCQMAADYMTLLTESGAFNREILRWPDAGNSTDITAIQEYIRARIVFMDSAIAAGDYNEE